VIPEPSNLDIAPLCRGILWGRLTVPGRSGHIEMPQPLWRDGGAVDAVAKGRVVMDAIEHLNRRWADDQSKNHPLLPIPCQVRMAQISAGEHPTTFAQQMQITVDVQYLPHERDNARLGGRVRRQIETFVREVAESDPWLREQGIGVEWLLDADCGEIPADHALVQACQAAAASAGADVSVQGMSSHTDMGLLIDAGVPTVTFGPGAPDVAHQPDERVSEDDLRRMTAAMALLIMDWCGLDQLA
jgi:acetylornithine deacetylase